MLDYNWEKLDEQCIVIVENQHKEDLLFHFYKRSFFPRFKLFTFKEWKQLLTYSLEDEVVLNFAKNNHFNMENAAIYLENLCYVQKNKHYLSLRLQTLQQLKEQNRSILVEKPEHLSFFKGKKIVVFSNDLHLKEIQALCLLYELDYVILQEKKTTLKKLDVFCFETIEEEVEYIAYQIASLIENKVPLHQIKICCNAEFLYPLQKVFGLFCLPLYQQPSYYIEIPFYNQFLNDLKNAQSVYEAMSHFQAQINQDAFANEIEHLIALCNQWAHMEFSDLILLLEYYFKTHQRKKEQSNTIEIIDYHQKIAADSYVFVLGLNQGCYPKMFKDEDFFSDDEKKELHLPTSEEKNQKEIEHLKSFFAQTQNLYLSYHLKENSKVCYPATIIDLWGLNVKKITLPYYDSYSAEYDKIKLADAYDKNIQNEMVQVLEENYAIDYCQYKNAFHIVKKQEFIDSIKDQNIELSYTSLNTFFQCPFQFYLTQLCSFKDTKVTFSQEIGSLFHAILAKEKDENFDFDALYDTYQSDAKKTEKEKFYFSKLKSELKNVMLFNQKMEQHTQLKKTLCEQKLIVPSNNPMILPIKGFIDKMMIYEDKEKAYYVLIDYKTGKATFSLKQLKYGLSLQLPVYLYLINHAKKQNQDVVIGFYLQKILPEVNKFPQDIEKFKQEHLKLQGYTIALKDQVALFDDTFHSSQFIKGLKTKKDGTFYSTSKVLTLEKMQQIDTLVQEKIKEASKAILSGDFKIQPKIINHKNESCTFCEYQSICNVKANNYLYLWLNEGDEDE